MKRKKPNRQKLSKQCNIIEPSSNSKIRTKLK